MTPSNTTSFIPFRRRRLDGALRPNIPAKEKEVAKGEYGGVEREYEGVIRE